MELQSDISGSTLISSEHISDFHAISLVGPLCKAVPCKLLGRPPRVEFAVTKGSFCASGDACIAFFLSIVVSTAWVKGFIWLPAMTQTWPLYIWMADLFSNLFFKVSSLSNFFRLDFFRGPMDGNLLGVTLFCTLWLCGPFCRYHMLEKIVFSPASTS